MIDILLVDDDELSAQLVQVYLRNRYSLYYEKNGREALPLTRENRYRLILLDIDLGMGLRGEDIVAEIRRDSLNMDIPVVAVTGYTEPMQRKAFLQAGFTHILSKPFKKKEFLELVESSLGTSP